MIDFNRPAYVAKELSFIYVDTGAMYRAMALYLIRKNVDRNNTEEIGEICQNAEISIEYKDGEQIVLLNGENVNAFLRTEEVGNMASAGAKNQKVREKLVELQRELASKADVVMDGRDIGTCVLPNANVKIYLTASVHTRAVRRYQEYLAKGEKITLEEVEKDIENRDYQDMNRAISPLKQAEDAVFLDSSDMGIEEVLETMISVYEKSK